MLYPKILNIEKGKRNKNILIIVSVIVSAILLLINVCVDFTNKWSLICIVAIIYVWITTMYSLKRNVNIASHVMVQMISVSLLMLAIDYILKYNGWSVIFGIPIVIMAGNATLTILTIVSRKKYIKYAIYQIIIFILSMIPLAFIKYYSQNFNVLVIISSSMATFTLLLTLILCGKDVYKDLVRRFHV